MKQCEFIVGPDHTIFVPPPTSWLGGMARHSWLYIYFGKRSKINITSKIAWDLLVNEEKTMILSEEFGEYHEKEKQNG